MKISGKEGFTLLELLIGVSIFALVAGSVYSSLYLGIKVYKQQENSDDLLQEAVLTFEQIGKALRCAFINLNNEKIKFLGTSEELNFFSVNKDGNLENLNFYLEPGSDKESFYLFKSIKKYTDLEGENSPEVKLINTKIRNLKFSYFNVEENNWYDDWPEQLKLPQQVKVEISFDATGADKQPLELIKYINIPGAGKIDLSDSEEF